MIIFLTCVLILAIVVCVVLASRKVMMTELKMAQSTMGWMWEIVELVAPVVLLAGGVVVGVVCGVIFYWGCEEKKPKNN